MKLITELHDQDVQYLYEGEAEKKALYIVGRCLVAEEQNRNGRIYPKHVLENEVKRYTTESIAKNKAYGELGHPSGPTINLDRVSHMIKDIRQEGNYFVGKAKILESTPMGKIAKALINEGANLGVSSRGLGSIVKNKAGVMEVQSDFRLASGFDIVSDPSGPGCFVQGVMEGAEWTYDATRDTYAEKTYEQFRDTVRKTPAKDLNYYAIFENFLDSLVKNPKQ